MADKLVEYWLDEGAGTTVASTGTSSGCNLTIDPDGSSDWETHTEGTGYDFANAAGASMLSGSLNGTDFASALDGSMTVAVALVFHVADVDEASAIFTVGNDVGLDATLAFMVNANGDGFDCFGFGSGDNKFSAGISESLFARVVKHVIVDTAADDRVVQLTNGVAVLDIFQPDEDATFTVVSGAKIGLGSPVWFYGIGTNAIPDGSVQYASVEITLEALSYYEDEATALEAEDDGGGGPPPPGPSGPVVPITSAVLMRL